MPYETRDLGVTVLGQTGYGKTTLLEQLILQDIAEGTAVIVVDAHGDLTQRILTLAEADEANLLLLEAWEDAPFRLNLFECPDPTSAIAVDRTVSGIVQVFKRLFGSPREFYPRLERDLGNAARTLIANNGTLLDVPRLFWDADFRTAALARVSNPHVCEFWRLWERMGREDRRLEQLEATINRLDQFLASEFVAQLVGDTESTIPFDAVLAGEGRVLLVSLPVGEIGEGLTNLLGSLFLAVLTERIFARVRLAPQDRPRVHLYLDEYGRYATPTTAQLLTEGRKFGIGTTIAHQTRAQIPDAENRAAELQVGTLICFQLIGADAQELAAEFHVAPEPQWEERVEEIEGTEPVLAITQAPVERLLQASHESPTVRAITQQLLLPIHQVANKISVESTHPTWGCGSYESEIGLGLINSLLVDVMEERVATTPDGLEDRLTDIVLRLREVWGYDDGFLGDQRLKEELRDVRGLVRGYVAHCLRVGPDSAHQAGVAEATARGLAEYAVTSGMVDILMQRWEARVREEVMQESTHGLFSESMSMSRRRGAGGLCNWTESKWHRRVQQEGPGERERLERAIGPVGTYIGQLAVLCRELEQAPILVPTGQERPRVRVRYVTHPQRSYQDVQNELAVELANLPRFTVYASVQGEQHRVRLTPPAEGEIDEERIERIRWISKAKFGRRPKPPVPPAMPDEPGEPPAGPRIGREHPDEE